ncbi:MAG: pyocin knob domain-containing protein [Actinomycetota bacterium]|nr:pyocin knob domain-containing protein [Actinomycetota bacterium]
MAGRFANLLGTILSSFGIGPKGAQATLSASTLTADRAHALPDKSGTVAVTSDITAAAVGLNNADNTSDVSKPVSTPQQTALNLKANAANGVHTGLMKMPGAYWSASNINTLNAAYDVNSLADMWINYRGYNEGFTQFRDFKIGDGKGAQVAVFEGSSKTLAVAGPVTAGTYLGANRGNAVSIAPLDVLGASNGRFLVRSNGTALTLDAVNAANNAYAPMYFTATSYSFGGGGTASFTSIETNGAITAGTTLNIGTGGTDDPGSLFSNSNWGMIFTAKQAGPVIADFLWQNSAKVERMRLNSGGLTLVNSIAASNYKTGDYGNADFNTITTAGFHRFNVPSANSPNIDYGNVMVAYAGTDTIAQMAFGHVGGTIKWRGAYGIGTTPVWSSWRTLWHDGNLTPDTAATANTVVKRTPDGYINSTFFNTTAPQQVGAVTSVFVEEANDGYIRKHSPTVFADEMSPAGAGRLLTRARRLNVTQLHDTTLPSGIYSNSGDGLTNPAGGLAYTGWWHVINHCHDTNGFASQVATELSSAGANKMIMRSSSGTSWRDWTEVMHSGNAPSGRTTPAVTLVTNVTTAAAYAAMWYRHGNMVSVSGRIDIQPTNAGNFVLRLSLPIASAFTSNLQAGGTAVAAGNASYAALLSVAATDDIEFNGNASGGNNQGFHYTYTYEVF